jgi:UDP-2,3-diacylglucosamine hydrolase
VTYLFISDLHLSPEHPRLVRGFLDLLDTYQQQQTQLYILGDWFNAWLGDDDSSAWLDHIVDALRAFTAAGNQIFFLVGNRDFALGQSFLDRFNGQLLPEIYQLNIADQRIRLEHGDLLCTDDLSYQRFRKVIRHPWVLKTLTCLPLKTRQKIAQGFRKKSIQTKQVKSYDIMDVNQQAVITALSDVDVLIHGHTHRPDLHTLLNKQRIVLGDWREDQATILLLNVKNNMIEYQMKNWSY